EERTKAGALPRRLRVCASCRTRDSGARSDLFIMKTGGDLQDNGTRDPGRERASKDSQLCGTKGPSLIKRKHCDKQRHGETDSGEPRITEQRCPAHSVRKFGNA